MLSWINGNKTYIVCAVTVLYAAVEYWTGAQTWSTSMDMILAALGVSGLRHGIAKV